MSNTTRAAAGVPLLMTAGVLVASLLAAGCGGTSSSSSAAGGTRGEVTPGVVAGETRPREYNSRWRFRSPLVRRQGFKLTG